MNNIPSFKEYSKQIISSPVPKETVKPKINYDKKTVDKKKLAVSVAAGVGIAALVVGGILYHKKINSSSIKKLAENIEFREANTLEEAIEFGKKYLGIKKYKKFKSGDLDVVNWVNEGLVNLNNRTKGNIRMPRVIKYRSFGANAEMLTGGMMNENGVLSISKEYIRDAKKAVTDILKTSANPEEQIAKYVNSKNFKLCNASLHKILKNLSPEQYQKYTSGTHASTFSVINHEMGHLQHCTSLNDTFMNIDSKFMELFKNSKGIASKVSDYATTSPTEFVAECYSKMCDGIKLDEDVLDLYKKLGGVII